MEFKTIKAPEKDYSDIQLIIRNTISKYLLNERQIKYLAWLYAVRVLPHWKTYLSLESIKVEDKLKHTYSLCKALDYSANLAINISYTSDVADDVEVSARAADIACANNAARAAFAVRIAYTINSSHDYHRMLGSIASVAAYTVTAFEGGLKNELLDIILRDLEYVKKEEYNKLNNDINIYGDLWDDFQNSLKDIGCEYWGDLYANIFKNGFKVDKENLKYRLGVPQEIQKQGAKGVADYLIELEKGSQNLNETRIIILGEKGAGKTCLATRLIDPNADTDTDSTIGVDTSIWEIGSDKNAVNAHIWDFAGHVVTHAAHRCFLSERCMYIIVYDGRTERRNFIEYWLDHVKTYGGNAPVRILVNIFDENKPRISENTLRGKYPFEIDFTYFSIKNDHEKLEMFRKQTSDFVLNNPMWNRQLIPSSYYEVKNRLRGLFKFSKKEYIDKTELELIADSVGLKNSEQEALFDSLHLLGICLWYKNIEGFNMVILNPDWIADGIYRTINWASNHSQYRIFLKDFESIFDDIKERYPVDKFRDIFKLMRKYELAYSEDGDSIVVPHLMNEDRPASLPNFSDDDSLMIKYVSEFPLPPNTVCRLIVRHHDEIRKDNEVWRFGVILKYGIDTIATVIEDDRTITITVKGSERSEYIAMLRSTMNEIFEDYKSDKPELQYRIIIPDELKTELTPAQQKGMDEYKKNNKVLMVPEKTIEGYFSNNRKYYDPETNNDIDFSPAVKNYNLNINASLFGVSGISF